MRFLIRGLLVKGYGPVITRLAAQDSTVNAALPPDKEFAFAEIKR
jgi:hypothetical protein